MIGYSKDVPEMFGHRNGKVVLRFNVVTESIVNEDGEIEAHYRFEQREFSPPVDRTVDGVKKLLKKIAAEKRWEIETGGLEWQDASGQSWSASTDRESQSKYVAAYVSARDGIRQPAGWKMADGRYPVLSDDEMVSLAMAVQGHVQVCYDKESAIRDEIDAIVSIDAAKIFLIQY